EGDAPEYSNSRIDWAAGGVAAPAATTAFADLSDAQKLVVARSLGYEYDSVNKRYFNYNAPIGKKVVTDFEQGAAVDYSNADIYWGAAGAPAAGTPFASLSEAQQRT